MNRGDSGDSVKTGWVDEFSEYCDSGESGEPGDSCIW